MPSEFICTIDGAQAETNLQNPPNSLITMILTDTKGSFAKMGFQVPDEVKREILAVGLAAITNQAQVLAVLDDPKQAQRGCYLLQVFVD
ncbi:MAG TPA: hypothetical protein VGZ29_05155 [Terriglobia bacterium]|nr:hypothetical protein [Terriglobia bacterium]